MVKKGYKYVTLLQIDIARGHDSVSKTWENYLARVHLFDSEGHLFEIKGHLFDREGHLFDRKGHSFWEGSHFRYKLLGGRDFDHVYKP